MAIIFGPDTFTVSSNTAIDQYPSIGSPDYAYCYGNNLIANATSDKVQVSAANSDTAIRCINSAVSSSMGNQQTNGDLLVPSGVGGACYPGLNVRYSTTTSGYVGLFQISDQTNEVAIYEDNAGTSLLASADRGLVLNTAYASTVRAVGTSGGTLITFIVGATAAVTFVDTTAPATGAPGMFLYDPAAQFASIDNFAVDDLAGYPLVAGVSTTNGSTATVSPVVNLPSGIQAGETLLMFIRNTEGGTITYPSGWTEMFENTADASNDTTGLAWKKADGTEGATLTMTSAFSVSGRYAGIVYRVLNAADPTVTPPEFSTIVIGTNTTPDPGTITPTGGSKKYLFFWFGGWDGEQTSPPSSFPTNYNSPVGANTGTTGAVALNCCVASAYRETEASSENPGTWTISAAPTGWAATAVAVHPIAAVAAMLPPPPTIRNIAVARSFNW